MCMTTTQADNVVDVVLLPETIRWFIMYVHQGIIREINGVTAIGTIVPVSRRSICGCGGRRGR